MKKIILFSLLCLLLIVPLAVSSCSCSKPTTPVPPANAFKPNSPQTTPSTPPTNSSQMTNLSVKELIQLVSGPNSKSMVESLLGKRLKVTGVIREKDFFANGYVGSVCLSTEGDANTNYDYVYAAAYLYEDKHLRQKLLDLKVGDRVIIEGIFFGSRPYSLNQFDKAKVSSVVSPPLWVTTDVCGIKIEEITKLP